MNVSLNVRRETIDVRLEIEDGLSPRDIQRALRGARVQFSTVSSRGQWAVGSQHIQQLVGALEQFSPVWDASRLLKKGSCWLDLADRVSSSHVLVRPK